MAWTVTNTIISGNTITFTATWNVGTASEVVIEDVQSARFPPATSVTERAARIAKLKLGLETARDAAIGVAGITSLGTILEDALNL